MSGTRKRALTVGAVVVVLAVVGAILAVVATRSGGSQAPRTWLAAGDSYSSGEGLPHATGPCARALPGSGSTTWADAAYPDVQGHDPHLASPQLVACTGAVTDALLTSPDKEGSPEWNPSLGTFDLVTFTFGGDDLGFSDIIRQCLGLRRLSSVIEARVGLPPGATLPSDPGHSCPSASLIEGGITTLAGRYRTFLDAVATRVVNHGGNVLVLGYPDLVEDPALWTGHTVGGTCSGLRPADATELRSLANDLDATLGDAVRSVDEQAPNGVHLRFVDVNSTLYEPSSGARHNLCSADPWINGLSAIGYGSGSFHPKQAGLDAEATLAGQVIDGMDWSHLRFS